MVKGSEQLAKKKCTDYSFKEVRELYEDHTKFQPQKQNLRPVNIFLACLAMHVVLEYLTGTGHTYMA